MRVGVVGSSGCIGTRLAEWLYLTGSAEVLPIIRTPSSYARFSKFGIEARVADALDRAALQQAFAGCDVVVHAAAGGRKLVEQSVASVYRSAQAADVFRLIYLSSASVYGQNPADNMDESTPLHCRHEIDYCNWKVRAEKSLERLRRNGNVEVVVLRPGIIFGPRSYWITSFVNELRDNRAYVVNGGSGICQSIYVDNLVHAIYKAMITQHVDGEAFIVGDQEQVTWKDLYEPIVNAMGREWGRAVHNVEPNRGISSLQQRYQTLRDTDFVQTVLRVLPVRLRYAISEGIDAWFADPLNQSVFESTSTGGPIVTREMTLLQQCQHKLPHAKASRLLGYDPHISFREGIDRTIGWLNFAGYLQNTGELVR
jgi:nucleoside-diphosphate-sugar epimerase